MKDLQQTGWSNLTQTVSNEFPFAENMQWDWLLDCNADWQAGVCSDSVGWLDFSDSEKAQVRSTQAD